MGVNRSVTYRAIRKSFNRANNVQLAVVRRSGGRSDIGRQRGGCGNERGGDSCGIAVEPIVRRRRGRKGRRIIWVSD
jgi:hypothetical protein